MVMVMVVRLVAETIKTITTVVAAMMMSIRHELGWKVVMRSGVRIILMMLMIVVVVTTDLLMNVVRDIGRFVPFLLQPGDALGVFVALLVGELC